MPELPDITIYIEALERRILDRRLERVQLHSPFLLRTASPALSTLEGKQVIELRRLGKRICFGFPDQLWMVLHLMIAGRLHWKADINAGGTARDRSGAVDRPSGRAHFAGAPKNRLATFQFDSGTLSLTEAGTQRRASLHIVQGEDGLKTLDRGGLELFQKPARQRAQTSEDQSLGAFIDVATFTRILKSENHTLKRALTDPRLFSGIGNAYSDEILWLAQLSPVKLTEKMTEDELKRLHAATRDSLVDWIKRLREETGNGFPEKVTAFREEMAVHGRYREPCPRCGARVQRIRYATNETNYCPNCQTGGKLLADRALSRLLREDWPRTAEELG